MYSHVSRADTNVLLRCFILTSYYYTLQLSYQDDASDAENQQLDGYKDGASGKSMTMEERREKMQHLRAKVVRCVAACCQFIY